MIELCRHSIEGDYISNKINDTTERIAKVIEAFRQNDFTANMAVEREYIMSLGKGVKSPRLILPRQSKLARYESANEKLFI